MGEPQVGNVVEACNRLTHRWVAAMPPGQFACSGPGVWPLLAMLAAGSTGTARSELEEALGLSGTEELADGVTSLHEILTGLDGAKFAAASWVSEQTELAADWVGRWPSDMVGVFPADPAPAIRKLNAWVSEATSGRVQSFPFALQSIPAMLLASALALRTEWVVPFTTCAIDWNERSVHGLSASFRDLDLASILGVGADAVGRFVSRGVGGFDVHVLTADPEVAPEQVLQTGIDSLTRSVEIRPGSTLTVNDTAGCLRVRMTDSRSTTPELLVRMPAVDLRATTNLAQFTDAFGVGAASDPSGDHFRNVCVNRPIYFEAGGQSVLARFFEEGFEATVVTSMLTGFTSYPSQKAMTISVAIDRPFGFLVVDRDTSLVLLAGWIEETVPDKWSE